MVDEGVQWHPVTELMNNAERIRFGRALSQLFKESPGDVLNFLSYYKFASKMIGKQKAVLDIGSAEGLGTWILALECGTSVGIETETELFENAKKNWTDRRVSFARSLDDWKRQTQATTVDAIVHIQKNQKPLDLSALVKSATPLLDKRGIFICAVNNSLGSLDAVLVQKTLSREFDHVFAFSAIGEAITVGLSPRGEYLIFLACKKKSFN